LGFPAPSDSEKAWPKRCPLPLADAVVVLGAKVAAPGIPSAGIRRRVAHAVRVLDERQIDPIVLSGGNAEAGLSEAVIMRGLALEQGVAADRIFLEDRSRNTFENAVYTGRLMMDNGWRRIVIVTDAWHMRRALYVFRHIGLNASGDPVRRPANVSRLAWARAYADDRLALARSAWLFWIGRDREMIKSVLGR
jgi:uncharacterized SAM-binding protein YcdF (DUF218 family)